MGEIIEQIVAMKDAENLGAIIVAIVVITAIISELIRAYAKIRSAEVGSGSHVTSEKFLRYVVAIVAVIALLLVASVIWHILQSDNENPESIRARGDQYFELGQFEEALQEYRKATELEPNRGLNYDKQALTLSGLGRHQEALDASIQAVTKAPNIAQYHYHKGDALRNLERDNRDKEEALAEYREAAKLDPYNAEYHHTLGVMLDSMEGDEKALTKYQEEALEAYRRAAELASDNAEYHHTLGVMLDSMQGDEKALAKYQEEALEAYRRAAELAPENDEYYYDLGKKLDSMGYYEEALEAYQRAAALDLNNASYHSHIGVTLNCMGHNKEALPEHQEAVRLEPKNALYHDNLGTALTLLEGYTEYYTEDYKTKALAEH